MLELESKLKVYSWSVQTSSRHSQRLSRLKCIQGLFRLRCVHGASRCNQDELRTCYIDSSYIQDKSRFGDHANEIKVHSRNVQTKFH